MRVLGTASALAMTVALASCNIDLGGGDDDDNDSSGASELPSQVVATGTITGFGSIYVNGRRFEVLESTSVEVEGQNAVLGGQSLLKLGQVVRVEASQPSSGDAAANTIVFDVDLRGLATGFAPSTDDPSVGSFLIIGQRVTIDAFTVLGEDFTDLNGDNVVDIRDLDGTISPSAEAFVVEVSGTVTQNGIIATRIDLIEERGGDVNVLGDEYDVKGFVDSIATDLTSFTMNSETIVIDGGTVFEDGLSASTLSVGDLIEAKLDRDSGGNYIAVEIEPVETIETNPPAEGSGFEVEGTIQSIDTTSSPNAIVINGITLTVDDASLFSGFVGRRIFVSGIVGANGRLEISSFDIEPTNSVAITDEVVSVDTAAGTITTRLGIVITPTGDSRVSDRANTDETVLMTPATFLSRVNAGDEVSGRAYIDSSENLIWTQVQRFSGSDGTCSLMGPVSNPIVVDEGFEVLGISVSLGFFSSFFDEDGDATDINGFFDELEVGDNVQLFSGQDTATCSNGQMNLSEAGKATLSTDDGIAETDDDPDETYIVVGVVSQSSDATGVIVIGDEEIIVGPETIIGSGVFSTAVGGPTEPSTDTAFGTANWPLSQLLLPNVSYTVEYDDDDKAISINVAA